MRMYIGRGVVIEDVLASEVDRAGIAMLPNSPELNVGQGAPAGNSIRSRHIVDDPCRPLDPGWY